MWWPEMLMLIEMVLHWHQLSKEPPLRLGGIPTRWQAIPCVRTHVVTTDTRFRCERGTTLKEIHVVARNWVWLLSLLYLQPRTACRWSGAGATYPVLEAHCERTRCPRLDWRPSHRSHPQHGCRSSHIAAQMIHRSLQSRPRRGRRGWLYLNDAIASQVKSS